MIIPLLISVSSLGIQYSGPNNIQLTENENSLAHADNDKGGGGGNDGGGGGNGGGNGGGKDKGPDDSGDESGDEPEEESEDESDESGDESGESADESGSRSDEDKENKNKVRGEFESADEFGEDESESKDEFEDEGDFEDEDDFESEEDFEDESKEKKDRGNGKFESEEELEEESEEESEEAEEVEEEEDKEKKDKVKDEAEEETEEEEGKEKEEKEKEDKYESEEIEAPELEEETLEEWEEKFKATKIEDGEEIPIDEPTDLPPIIVAEEENLEEIQEAIEEQETVQLDVAFPELTDGSDVIETFDLPTFDLPEEPDVVAIVPPIATTVDPEVGQTVATPPLDEIIPGQEIIVPVDETVLADFGGILQLNVEPAEDAEAVGETEEWFVVATNDEIPEELPTLQESGIENTLDLFIDVSYPFEETGAGFDWTDPETHAKPVEFEFLIDKPIPLEEQVATTNGCPDVDIFVLDETVDPPTWTTEGVRVLSVTSTDSSCKISAQSDHLSKFAIGGIGSTVLVVGGIEEQKKGCLIATAAFGSELAPQVQLLRETRDNIVLKTQSGVAFMTAFNEFYYSFAPTVADWERQNPIFKEIVKITITPLITTLSILNYVNIDSEAQMLGYGIAIILLNIGMYFALPILGIVKFRHRFQISS